MDTKTASVGDLFLARALSPMGSSMCQGVQSKVGRSNDLLRERPMQKPPLDPDVADVAPFDAVLTAYDEQHIITYLRLLDADAERS